jgi:hypothetical protein
MKYIKMYYAGSRARFSDFTDPPHYPMYFIWNATDSGSVCTDFDGKLEFFLIFHRTLRK